MRNDKKAQSWATANPDPARFVTASELARKCGVSRQFVSKAVREGMLRKTPSGLIDLNDELSVLFSEERKGRGTTSEPKIPAGMRVVTEDDDDEDGEDDEDSEDEDSESLLDLKIRKIRAEVKKRELEIAQIEGAVIDERIIASLIEAFGQGIRLNFVDVCLRQSEQICAMLGCPGKEREVQEYLEVDNGRRLEEVKRNTEKIKNTMKRTRIERGLDKEEGRR